MEGTYGSADHPIQIDDYVITVTGTDRAGNTATKTATFSKEQISVDGINATTVSNEQTSVQFETNGAVNNANVTVTQHVENPSGNADHPGGANSSAGAFVEINAPPELRDNLKQLTIRVYYNPSELGNTDPLTLKIYLWDVTWGMWRALADSHVNTTEHYIEGTTDHLSKYGVFGSVLAAPPPAVVPPPVGGGGGGESGKLVKLDGLKNSAPYEFRLAFTGAAQTNVQLKSEDEKLSIDIASGTYLRDKVGNALGALSVVSLDNPPAPPSGSVLVMAYNFGPDGAVFDPGINLTISYDPKTLPAGAREEELYTAWWNGTNWQALTGTVNTAARTVSVKVNHFTQFALMSKLPSVSPVPAVPAPAKFSISELSVAPAAVKTAETVTVTATVTNNGGIQGRYTVSLRVNGVEEEKKELTLNAGAVEKVSFTLQKSAAGNYSVDVNGLAGQFTVKEEAKASPTPAPVPQEGGINATTIIIILLAVVVVAGLIAFFRLRKRHT